MKLLTKKADLEEKIKELSANSIKIGFIPTMGALHEGHMALVKRSKEENDSTVVSIFVNPTQFNNKNDLLNYPKTLEADIIALSKVEADFLFAPDVEEMYPNEKKEALFIDFKHLDKVMEGKHRPGHFQGVAQIVRMLFEIVKPSSAYFGEKDFQQLAIIKYLVKELNIPVNIIGHPTVRETSGLAMSSRNMRLTENEKMEAAVIFRALDWVRKSGRNYSISEAIHLSKALIESSGLLQVEYLDIADESNLLTLQSWDQQLKARAFTAVKVGDVRLIDNMPL